MKANDPSVARGGLVRTDPPGGRLHPGGDAPRFAAEVMGKLCTLASSQCTLTGRLHHLAVASRRNGPNAPAPFLTLQVPMLHSALS